SGYKAPNEDRVYETASLRSTRRAGDGSEVEVHVYDMYWTDISRVATSGLRMFGELYQLLFYVCGLGRHTLDFATAASPNSRYWRFFALLDRYAERVLVIWIPIANLCALGLGILVVPQQIYSLPSPH